MPMNRTNPRHNSNSGFTAVVIAAIFIAFAVVAAAVVERNTTIQQVRQRDRAGDQLTRLSNALIEYAIANNSGSTNLYPCPARMDVAAGTSTFGDAVTNCWDTIQPLDPTIDVPGSPANTSVIRGMVPVLKLSPYGINIEDAFDPWNNRIMYVVNRRMTINSIVFAGAATDNPTVTDSRTGQIIAAPDFVLISYGRDGRGSSKRGDTSVSITCPATSTLLREENCDTDIIFAVAPTYISAAATSTTYFDDILTWYRQ